MSFPGFLLFVSEWGAQFSPCLIKAGSLQARFHVFSKGQQPVPSLSVPVDMPLPIGAGGTQNTAIWHTGVHS